MTTNRQSRFLKDDPIQDLSLEDSFGHRSYTEVLADAVLEADPPFTIGVFGEWGVGKTTITKDYLSKALKSRSGDAAYAYFDVWKYEGHSLRRQFLNDVADQLKQQDALQPSYAPEKELRDLIDDVSEPSVVGFGLSWRHGVLAVVRALIAFGILFGALQLIGTGTSSATKLTLSAVVAILVGLSGELGQVLEIRQTVATRKSIDSPDLFEDRFVDLMKSVKRKRVVIVVDNLDQCTPGRVMEMLATIKTFLEPARAKVPPVFVIPCDERAVLRHLRKPGVIDEESAAEYLRKFFGLTLRISPLLDEEIRQYVLLELEKTDLGSSLGEEVRKELGQIVAAAFRANPRRVKQFLNTLSVRLALIQERESSGFIDPPISDSVAFLARLSVIEEKWPEFYAAIQRDPRIFEGTSQHALGVQAAGSEGSQFEGAQEDLLAFLRATRRYHAKGDLRVFLRLRGSPAERRLSAYVDFRNALTDGHLETIERILDEADDDDRRSYGHAAIEILDDERGNGYFDSAISVIDAVTRVDNLRATSTAEETTERLWADPSLRQLLPSLNPIATIRMLDTVESDARDSLVDNYVALLGEDLPGVADEARGRWQTDVVRGLTRPECNLTDEQVGKIKQLAKGPLATNMDVLASLASAEDGPSRFLTDEALREAVDQLSTETLVFQDDGVSLQLTPPLTVWIRSLEFAAEPSVERFGGKVQELLANIPAQTSAPTRNEVLELLVLSRSVLGRIEPGVADQIVQLLWKQYPATASHFRWKVLMAECSLYPGASGGAQQQIRQHLAQFSSEDVDSVGVFVAAGNSFDWDTVPAELREDLLNRLADRFRASSKPKEQQSLVGMFLGSAPGIGWERVDDLFARAISGGNPEAVTHALLTFGDRIAEEHSQSLDSIARALLARLSAHPTSELGSLFEAIYLVGGLLTDDDHRTIRDHLLSQMTSEDPGVRAVGAELHTDASKRGLLGEPERQHVAEQLIAWIYGRADQLGDPFRDVMARVVADIELVEESLRLNLLSALKGALARPDGRSLAAEFLPALPLARSQLNEITEELLHAAEQEADPIRAALVKGAHRLASQDKRSKGWKRIETMMDELEGGSDADRSLANELRGEG